MATDHVDGLLSRREALRRLALLGVGTVGPGLTPLSTVYVVGFAVLLVLMAGIQGRPWAIWANLGVQLVLVAGWFIYPAVGFIGL
ncbi:DUF4233 domain-containing protein, partial [Mycobacterium sp. NAZ190054]|uniref:DUF4233 domain-containing protein n=1 Tax=Mycobacterium sp. NAZ190054 TaxID=1747766 RepID=UPI001E47AAFC